MTVFIHCFLFTVIVNESWVFELSQCHMIHLGNDNWKLYDRITSSSQALRSCSAKCSPYNLKIIINEINKNLVWMFACYYGKHNFSSPEESHILRYFYIKSRWINRVLRMIFVERRICTMFSSHLYRRLVSISIILSWFVCLSVASLSTFYSMTVVCCIDKTRAKGSGKSTCLIPGSQNSMESRHFRNLVQCLGSCMTDTTCSSYEYDLTHLRLFVGSWNYSRLFRVLGKI